jgi:hypothetical protein
MTRKDASGWSKWDTASEFSRPPPPSRLLLRSFRRAPLQLGWSRAYSFNTGDLTVCGNILADYARRAASAATNGAAALSPSDVLPWADLRYLIGSIAYGGHITDAFGA